MPPQIAQLEARINELERRINALFFSDRYLFSRDIELEGGRNIQLSTNTGSQFGTATNQLLSFYGVTPVDQPATVADPTGGATVDSQARDGVVNLIDRLQELGLIA